MIKMLFSVVGQTDRSSLCLTVLLHNIKKDIKKALPIDSAFLFFRSDKFKTLLHDFLYNLL